MPSVLLVSDYSVGEPGGWERESLSERTGDQMWQQAKVNSNGLDF